MNYLIPFLSTFVISVVLTGVLWRSGIKMGLLVRPRKRDIHTEPVSRIGGIGIFTSFLVVSLIVFLANRTGLQFSTIKIFGLDTHLWAIWLGGALVACVMFLDDLRGLSAKKKLIAQILVAFVVIACGVGVDSLTNPFGGSFNLNSVYIPILTYHGVTYHFSLWSDILTTIWLVGMMNVMNFVDGVDGLAGGQAVIASLTIFLLSISVNQPATAMIAIILAGAALGFLIWNFPPAKIFMGDSGSMFLGFVLGLLSLISGGKLATVFLVMGFPIIDGLIVAGSRMARGKNPFTTPDKTHLHHRFLAAGFSPREAVLSLYFISALFGLVALSSSTKGKAFGIVFLLLVIIWLMKYLERIKKGR